LRTIILTGAGGRLGVVHARAIKKADPGIRLIGIDAHPYRIQRAITDETYLVPLASSRDYLPTVRAIVARTKAKAIIPNVTVDIPALSKGRRELGCRVFLPRHETVETCEDKSRSAAVWQKAGVAVPRSMLVRSRDDLETAFNELGPDLWVRAISGSGAAGALPVSNMDDAVKWISLNRGWGRFMAAERLGQETTSWESVWRDGELIVAQARKRLYWEFGRIAPSGVSGIAGAGEAVSDPQIDELAMAAIRAVDKKPNGILGVDIAYSRDGVPMVTEINPGRFMSGGVCHFAENDFNIPVIAARVALGESPGVKAPLLNPVTEGLVFVSGLDREPVFTTREKTAEIEAALREMLDEDGLNRAVGE
jgi:carbamoyl-phosphate synthase large subunit